MSEQNVSHTIEADKALMHLNYGNRRMLIALVTVCMTFIVTILVFVIGYTKREENWLRTLTQIKSSPGITEVWNGDQQKADP